jgi:excisionase family DNA binding protein
VNGGEEPAVEPSLTVLQAAAVESVTGDTVLGWIRAGHLGAYRLPSGQYRIPISDLHTFRARGRVAP